MSRRKTFKILPRHTAKGDVVRYFEKGIKRQVKKRSNSLISEKVAEKKKNKRSL